MSSIVLYTIVTTMLNILGGTAAYLNGRKRMEDRSLKVIAGIGFGIWGIYSLLIYFNST